MRFARTLPLKSSTELRSVGLPSREKSSVKPFRYAYPEITIDDLRFQDETDQSWKATSARARSGVSRTLSSR